MLPQARTRKEREAERFWNVRFFEHDITDLASLPEIEAGDFDVVTCASLFVLLENPIEATHGWVKYLKPGGKLVVDVPHPRNHTNGRLMEQVRRRLNLPAPYSRSFVTSEKSLRKLLEAARLIVEMLQFVKHAGYGLRYYGLEKAAEIFHGNHESE